MAYSETKVVLGGLAHIPIIIGFFYLIQRQYSFGALLRTGKNALSDKVKTSPAKASSSSKPSAAKAVSTPAAAAKATTINKPAAASKAAQTSAAADKATTINKSAAAADKAAQTSAAATPPETSKPVSKSTQSAPTKVVAANKPHADVPVNTYKPKAPFTGTVTENYSALKDGAIGKVQHITFDISGGDPDFKYVEGQSCGILAAGEDAKGKPHRPRLYSIASTRYGDNFEGNTLSLCVRQLQYEKDGETINGVCSTYLCNLSPGDKVKISGPVGKEMLLPDEEDSNIIMLATGTGIAPMRAYLRRMFEPTEIEKHKWNFKGKAWLFMGAPKTANLLYDADFEHYKSKFPENLRYTKAISREQQNTKGGRMYIQDRVLEHAEEIFNMIEDPKTHIYLCGLKGMEPGIDEAMTTAAAAKGLDWAELRPKLRKAGRWHAETY